MATHPEQHVPSDIFENIRGTRDAITVKRVFGDPYEVDGTTIIPVAKVMGGGGGGGGESEGDDAGQGYGSGFGLRATALGVYRVRDGDVCWRPAIDVTRLMRGCQVLMGIIAVCATLVRLRGNRPVD